MERDLSSGVDADLALLRSELESRTEQLVEIQSDWLRRAVAPTSAPMLGSGSLEPSAASRVPEPSQLPLLKSPVRAFSVPALATRAGTVPFLFAAVECARGEPPSHVASCWGLVCFPSRRSVCL